MRVFEIFVLTLCIISECRGGCPFSNSVNSDKEILQHNRLKRDSDDVVADPATTTNKGCHCKSYCSATIDFSLAKYDWCYTDNKCGEWSWTRWKYYDWCKYLDISKPNNLAKDWQTKTDEIISMIKADAHSGKYENALKIMDESVNTVFDDEWDTMPAARKKLIHSVGGVCKFTLDIKNSSYTGMFKSGTQTGIIRLGSALDVSGGAGVVPGVGVKFLRTGRSSANFVALNSLDAMPDKHYNFFAVSLMNHIASPNSAATKILGKKFKQASDCITKVGLSDVAKYDQDGNEADNVVFPFKVTLKPTGDVEFNDGESSLEDFSKQWGTIPIGAGLYEFIAHSSPDDEEGTELGKLIAVDGCTTSKFGDENLFFRHQRIEDDINMMRNWKNNYMTEC